MFFFFYSFRVWRVVISQRKKMGDLSLRTWLVLLFYLITNLWLLTVGSVALSDLIKTDSSHIHPLAWSISIPICSGVIQIIWFVIFVNGWKSRNLKDEQKDVTNINYTSYKAWAYRSMLVLLTFTICSSISIISYSARFSSTDPRALSDFAMESSRVWNVAALAFPSSLAFATLFSMSNAAWKYWALIWSCSDQSMFKSPFFPERSIRFHKD